MNTTDELRHLLNGFEHECYMLRVEASETRAKDEDVRKAYERIREESARAIAATLGGGKLTAEQVRRCVRVGACDHGLWEAIDEDTDWQAIADELNATLGGGECEVELRESGWGGYTRHCGACGADLDCDTRNRQNFCPNCGRKVKR